MYKSPECLSVKLHQQSHNPGTTMHLSAYGAPGMGPKTHTHCLSHVYFYFADAPIQSNTQYK